MKVFASLVLALLVSTSALASGLDMFKTVINSEALKTLSTELETEGYSLSKVEVTQVYRCPACFDYEATFEKYDPTVEGMVTLKKTLHTSLGFVDGESVVTVRVQE